MSTINLPAVTKTDSASSTKLFFDTYGSRPLEFGANEVSASIGFFTGRGFEEEAALTTACSPHLSTIYFPIMSYRCARIIDSDHADR